MRFFHQPNGRELRRLFYYVLRRPLSQYATDILLGIVVSNNGKVGRGPTGKTILSAKLCKLVNRNFGSPRINYEISKDFILAVSVRSLPIKNEREKKHAV